MDLNGQRAGLPVADVHRNTRYNRGNFIANYGRPESGYFHTGMNRYGVTQLNWAGLHTSDMWQNFHAAEPHKQVVSGQVYPSIQTRLWAIDQRARTPIPTNRYAVDPSALMAGNFRATNPQGV